MSLKIGELAKRTQVASRLIRYYEEQGLLTAKRSANGYRYYEEDHVTRVKRVAGLVQAGLPTRLVKVLIEAEDAVAQGRPSCPIAIAEQLAQELEGLEARIGCLTRSRDTVRNYLMQTKHEALIT